MQKKLTITIPMFVFNKQNDLYDHPTPMQNFANDETSSRLLTSLVKYVPEDVALDIILLYGKTTPTDVENKDVDVLLQQTYAQTVTTQKQIRLLLAGSDFLKVVEKLVLPYNLSSTFNNIGYGSVRNLQLLLQLAFNTEWQVNLDDDEIVTDEMFFIHIQKLQQYIHEHQHIGGFGGLYLDDTGSPDILKNIETMPQDINIFQKKEYFMQEMVELWKKKEITEPTSCVFGGLTLMHQKLAEVICYDPAIPRGEDIDFLINALFKDLCFGIDSRWSILHKPPGKSLGSGHIPTKEKKIRDVRRFLYLKAKIDRFCEVFGYDKEKIISLLQPYPSEFIKVSYEQLIQDASDLCTKEELETFLQNEVPAHIENFLYLWEKWPYIVKDVQNSELQKKLIVIA